MCLAILGKCSFLSLRVLRARLSGASVVHGRKIFDAPIRLGARLVVGAVNSPYEPRHIILLDPNWREPKYEPRDQEWLERQDTTFELLLPVVVERRGE